MSEAPKMTYVVTALFDDGVYKIEDNEWVQIGPPRPSGPRRHEYQWTTAGWRLEVDDDGRKAFRYVSEKVA